MKIWAMSAAASVALSISVQQPPATEIYLASFVDGARVSAGSPINITNNPGYDNQPYFLRDSSGVLFASNRDGKQNDIYRYDITSKTVTQVTSTPENEYSPTVTPDGKTFTTIRGAEQRLWRFNPDGSDAGMVWGDRGLIGYHAWITPQLLGAFVLGKPNTLELIDLQARTSEAVESNIGRSLHIRPGRGTFTFVHKPADGAWVIKELESENAEDRHADADGQRQRGLRVDAERTDRDGREVEAVLLGIIRGRLARDGRSRHAGGDSHHAAGDQSRRQMDSSGVVSATLTTMEAPVFGSALALPGDEETHRRQRQDAAWLCVLPIRSSWPELPSAVPARAHAEADAGARRVRRQVHDRLPRGVSGKLVRPREAVSGPSQPASQLLWCERVSVARHLAP